jgi:hypothetical protein
LCFLQEEFELHVKQILHAYGRLSKLLGEGRTELQRMQKADQINR